MPFTLDMNAGVRSPLRFLFTWCQRTICRVDVASLSWVTVALNLSSCLTYEQQWLYMNNNFILE